MTVTLTTKAEEIGLESEMPMLIPFTRMNTEARAIPITA